MNNTDLQQRRADVVPRGIPLTIGDDLLDEGLDRLEDALKAALVVGA